MKRITDDNLQQPSSSNDKPPIYKSADRQKENLKVSTLPQIQVSDIDSPFKEKAEDEPIDDGVCTELEPNQNQEDPLRVKE